jgi:hypothetical protein
MPETLTPKSAVTKAIEDDQTHPDISALHLASVHAYL